MESSEEVTKTRDEMQERISALEKELQLSRDAMHRSQSCLHQHQAKSNYLTTSLQAQLRRKDQEIKRIREHQDRQIENIVSHLLFLEGQIRKDQKQYVSLLLEKERKIKEQRIEIDELKERNNNLVIALKDVHISPTGHNGFVQDSTPERHEYASNGVQYRTPKEKEKAQRLKFTGMRERLRRHRSSFELHHPEPLETLEEMTIRSSSQENLTDDVIEERKERRNTMPAKERPKSMIEMPSRSNEYPLLDFPKEIDLDHEYEDEVYDKLDDDDIFSNSSESADLTKSYSMPHDISRIANGIPEEIKERPHSMSSVELLAAETAAKTPNPHQHKHHKNHKQQKHKQEQQTPQKQQQSSPSEGNPFKSIKTMLKRKGSKLRNKKRSVSLPQGTNQEYAEALKKHFEKYDLS